MGYSNKVPRIPNVRRVWRAVTLNPHASVRELAKASDLSNDTTQRSLALLDTLGYIEQSSVGASRARRVVVPFVEVRR